VAIAILAEEIKFVLKALTDIITTLLALAFPLLKGSITSGGEQVKAGIDTLINDLAGKAETGLAFAAVQMASAVGVNSDKFQTDIGKVITSTFNVSQEDFEKKMTAAEEKGKTQFDLMYGALVAPGGLWKIGEDGVLKAADITTGPDGIAATLSDGLQVCSDVGAGKVASMVTNINAEWDKLSTGGGGGTSSKSGSSFNFKTQLYVMKSGGGVIGTAAGILYKMVYN
jgi:hypothetical protein